MTWFLPEAGEGSALRRTVLVTLALAAWSPSFAGDLAGSRILATAGASTIEGSAGGGITPWAMLAGYGDVGEAGCAGAVSRLTTQDYGLDSLGIACSINNRFEVSVARQDLSLDGLRGPLGLRANQKLRQAVAGVKIRLLGDHVYGRYGQLSMGVVYKDNLDEPLVTVAGARRTNDVESYLSAGKLFIDGPFGMMAYANAAVRWTRANQGGLLGFGGDREQGRSLHPEFAAAILPRRDLAIGVEYRAKPDNLGFAKEEDWHDVFVAWFPSKHLSVVAAWVDLGSVGTLRDQDGLYVSLAGSF